MENCQVFLLKKNGWIAVRDDLYNLVDDVKKKYPTIPCFLLAHSMGSWIALSLLNKKLDIDGLILSGSSKVPHSLIYLQLLIIKIEILRHGHKAQSKLIDALTMRKFNNSFTPNRTAHDWISSDIESVDNYTSDPLCGFIVTNSLWHDVCICMLNIFKKNFYSSKNFNIPMIKETIKNPNKQHWKFLMSYKNHISNLKLNINLYYKFSNKIPQNFNWYYLKKDNTEFVPTFTKKIFRQVLTLF